VRYLVLGTNTFQCIHEEIMYIKNNPLKRPFQRFKIEVFSSLREIIVVGYYSYAHYGSEGVLFHERMRQDVLDVFPQEKVPKFNF
jgi:hypothetical protein